MRPEDDAAAGEVRRAAAALAGAAGALLAVRLLAAAATSPRVLVSCVPVRRWPAAPSTTWCTTALIGRGEQALGELDRADAVPLRS